MSYLAEYDELGFEELPEWLRHEIRSRDLPIPRREPTELEMWEAEKDAKEHRILHNELTIEDIKGKYMRQQPLTIFT